MRPGSWKDVRPATMSPDEAKKRASGFWSHEYLMESMETLWRCNLPVLHDTVRGILMDQRESRMFSEDPHRYLDTRFGEGTAYCYFYKQGWKEKYIDMRTPDHFMIGRDYTRDDRVDAMAYANMTGSTWTGSNTTTTSGTLFVDNNAFTKTILEDAQRQMKKKADSFTFKKKLLKTFPFKQRSSSLLASLQDEFDHWAGDARKELFHT